MNSKAPNETHLSEAHKAALYLIACALNGIRPEESVTAAIDHESLYKFADSQNIEAMLGWILAETDCGEMTLRWKNAVNSSIRKNILFDAERAKVLSFLEEKGIWHMPLKGVLLKDLYPAYGLREMGDNDILFDPEAASSLKDFFLSQGYECIMYARSNHDVYSKPPYFTFEMHTSLFGKSSPYSKYYLHVKDRLIRDEGSVCGYHFSDEDFYIFLYLHFAKHLHGRGAGLRFLTDLYLYRSHYPHLNSAYISGELSRFDLAEEEEFIQKLIRKLFSSPDPDSFSSLDPGEKAFFLQVLTNGTFGSLETYVSNKLAKYSSSSPLARKLHYVKDRLFPELEPTLPYYPAFFTRHRWALPLFYIYRIFNRLIVKRKRLWKEIKLLIRQ